MQLVRTGKSQTGIAALLGPGATWGEVQRKIPTEIFSYPHGQCKSVGVGGYLLGGGVNWLGTYNKYGYGAENVLSMRAVLSDGRIAEVTPEETNVSGCCKAKDISYFPFPDNSSYTRNNPSHR